MSNLRAAGALISAEELRARSESLVEADGAAFALVHPLADECLAVLAPAGSPSIARFEGEVSDYSDHTLLVGPLSPRNAAALRESLTWLRPQPLGLQTSVGFGDRLGLATPGHARALRASGGHLAPIFAQQSIREMDRTNRSPQQVMDDATWGAFAVGWHSRVGADADHLKTTVHVDICVAAGYTFFTFDPGDHVTDGLDTASADTLRRVLTSLPWDQLEDTPRSLTERYRRQTFDIEGHRIAFDEVTVLRSAGKYGRAVAHAAGLYRHLTSLTGGSDCEVEISVDETRTQTTHADHIYIVSELRRLGVEWVSLAPRYVGRFEKGTDYIGDHTEFEADFAVHAAIARQFGPYKLSLHSGSDKFSIYDAAVQQARGLVHLKTAGTSYLEALRAIAVLNPPLFRRIYNSALRHYETDRASYHVSATLECAPQLDGMPDSSLPEVLDHFDGRQILHVTFGSILREEAVGSVPAFHDEIMAELTSHPEVYSIYLQAHFLRHLRPFAAGSRA